MATLSATKIIKVTNTTQKMNELHQLIGFDYQACKEKKNEKESYCFQQWRHISKPEPLPFASKTYAVFLLSESLDYLYSKYPEDLVLCAGYSHISSGIFSDIQAGYSETLHQGESAMHAFNRGIREEILYDLNDKSKIKDITSVVNSRNLVSYKKTSICHVNVNSSNMFTKINKETFVTERGNDNRSHKALILIHGSVEILKETFNIFSTTEDYRSTVKENRNKYFISSYNLISIRDLCKFYC